MSGSRGGEGGGWERRLLLAFAALSLTSLFADMAYEGARSVVGPYLRVLQAGLVVAGAVSVGDLVAYSARFLGGVLAGRVGGPRGLWALIFAGYTVNLVAVPLLALAGHWWEAFTLVIIERLGKGLRTAPRDVVLAEVSRGAPRGLVFSLHEAADQLGAVAGSVLVALVLASGHGYRAAFALLALPAAGALASLAAAYRLYPEPREALRRPEGVRGRLGRGVLAASIAGGLGMAALVHWAQASYRLSSWTGAAEVAGLYALAMVVDGVVAVPVGLLYDRLPGAALALGPMLSGAATLLLLQAAPPAAFAVLWGSAMAVYESAYRAHIASTAAVGERGRAYAALYGSMGLGWALGNIAMALLPPGVTALLVAACASGGAAAALAAGASRRGQ